MLLTPVNTCSSCGYTLRKACTTTIHIVEGGYSIVDYICHACDEMLRTACRNMKWAVDPRSDEFTCDCWLQGMKELEDA